MTTPIIPPMTADLSSLPPHPAWCYAAAEPLAECVDAWGDRLHGAHHCSDLGGVGGVGLSHRVDLPGFGVLRMRADTPWVSLRRSDLPGITGPVTISLQVEELEVDEYSEMTPAMARALGAELIAAAVEAELEEG